MENFIPVYPSIEDPDIQRIITSKREFNILRPNKEDVLVEGVRKLKNSQVLFERLMTITDRMLNIHETGTGKTCAFIAAAEKFKHKGALKKCIILENGNTLVNEIRNQIVEKCTPEGEYNLIYDEDDEILTDKIRRKRRNKSLSSWYKFETYTKFTTDLSTMSDDQIISEFSKCFFIFDEAHNVISEKDKIEGSNRYLQIKRLCGLVNQSKICMVSATPMINNMQEGILMMNLLLPLDNQIPIKNNYRLSELEPYFRGKISFIKSDLSNIEVVYMGKKFEFKQIKKDLDPSLDGLEDRTISIPIELYLTSMGDLQLEQYIATPKDSLRSKEKNFSSFVFPKINGNVTVGSDYYEEVSGKLKWKNNVNFLEWEERGNYISFQDWIYNNGDYSNLDRVSGKLSEIIQIEKREPGCSFIFTELSEGPGAKIFTLIFSLFGFEIFSENNSDIIYSNKERTKIKESFVKKPRVALITGGVYGNDSRQDTIITLFNSKENVNGEYIKLIIGSKKTRDGLNLYHCRRMHLFYPHWNYSGMIQAINRVLRATSHNALKELKHREAIDKGYLEGSKEYKEYTNITVKVYRHCIDYNLDANIHGYNDDNSDYTFMKKAIEKEVSINYMMNMMKICAVDAIINRPANELSISDPFNIDKIKYLPSWTEIMDPTYVPYISDPIDYSTYNVLYIDSSKIVNRIRKILLDKGYISYQHIYDLFKDNIEEDIFDAIEKFRSSEKYIINELGEKLKLEILENGLTLQKFNNTYDSRFISDISIYNFPQIAVVNNGLSDFLNRKSRFFIKNKLQKLTENFDNFTKDKFDEKVEFLQSLDRYSQLLILEELVYSITNNKKAVDLSLAKDISIELLKIFKGYIFSFKYEEETVWIHTMTTTIINESKNNTLSLHLNPKQIKILIPKEKMIGWRLPIKDEDKIFRDLIKDEVENNMNKYTKYKPFGTILQDGKFRLNNYEDIGKDTLNVGQSDKRFMSRGKKPESERREILIKVAVFENLKPCNKKINLTQDNIRYLRESIKAEHSENYVKSLSDEQIVLYNQWLNCSNVSKIFQEEIIKKMKSDGRIYEPYILTYD